MQEHNKTVSKEKRERAAKIVSYVMLLILFGTAVYLPKYAVKWKAKELAVAVQTTEAADPDRLTIVLDPGHGGSDPGMVEGRGIQEKTLNLIYARKLQALLEEKGYRVVLTRNTDEGLYDPGSSNQKAQDMQRRCQIIAEEAPVLTVSIHQNSYAQDPAVCGPQVFYYEHSVEGKKLAERIQEALNRGLEISRPRSVKGNTSYYILKRSVSTTVIVECGFLTNPEEEAKLQEEDYQDQFVKCLESGIEVFVDSCKSP